MHIVRPALPCTSYSVSIIVFRYAHSEPAFLFTCGASANCISDNFNKIDAAFSGGK